MQSLDRRGCVDPLMCEVKFVDLPSLDGNSIHRFQYTTLLGSGLFLGT